MPSSTARTAVLRTLKSQRGTTPRQKKFCLALPIKEPASTTQINLNCLKRFIAERRSDRMSQVTDWDFTSSNGSCKRREAESRSVLHRMAVRPSHFISRQRYEPCAHSPR